MIKITDYYQSTARQRRDGTNCHICNKKFKAGQQLMRTNRGKNNLGCTIYQELCYPCFNKNLKSGIEEAKQELRLYIEQEEGRIKELENQAKGF